jgi:hypothetical protein
MVKDDRYYGDERWFITMELSDIGQNYNIGSYDDVAEWCLSWAVRQLRDAKFKMPATIPVDDSEAHIERNFKVCYEVTVGVCVCVSRSTSVCVCVCVCVCVSRSMEVCCVLLVEGGHSRLRRRHGVVYEASHRASV